MTRTDVVDDARLWLGTPYVHQASLRSKGSDCIGMPAGIARDRGTAEGVAWAADRAMHNYGPLPNPRFLIDACERYLDRIPTASADFGDIVLMRFTQEPQHFAIIVATDPPYIVHASRSVGKVVEHRLDEVWRSRIRLAYRYRGLE